MRQIILDTETTGLNPELGHRVIEIGCLEMVNRRLTGESFHYYINPEREIDAGATAIHGIKTEFLLDKPKFSEVADQFIDFIKGSELIIHNAAFDVGFLNYEFKLLKKIAEIAEYCEIFDTLQFARRKHPGQRNSLDALCKRYHVDNSGREWHGALLDAELLAGVYLAMTGGQSTLFGGSLTREKTQQQKKIAASADLSQYKIPVVNASAEEIAAHEALMKEIEKV